MQRILFHSTIFGPIHSRRLGTSLGVNLSPRDGKVCTFDCLYCEAGYNAQGPGVAGLPPREEVARLLEAKLSHMAAKGERLDVITFSGNGEPTAHPQFADIIADTLALRDRYFPQVKVSVLCNSTQLGHEAVRQALLTVDNAILKLDSARDRTIRLLDRPTSPAFTAEKVIAWLRLFEGVGIIQTMLTRGTHDGEVIDNTSPEEIDALIEAYRLIRPREVMLYSLDRPTPELSLQKVPRAELEAVADRVRALGIPVQVA